MGIFLVSGPSGAGKSTLIKKLISEFNNIYFSISSTTRDKRNGEIDGVNYNFISKDEFQNGIENNEFLEWAFVHNNYYGTSLKPVLSALSQNKIVVFDIDVQGQRIANKKFKNLITSVFITTKNQTTLENRLQKRQSDDEKTIKNRIQNAVTEMEAIKEYDYFLINDNLDKCYENFKKIFETLQFKTQNLDLEKTIKNWKNKGE